MSSNKSSSVTNLLLGALGLGAVAAAGYYLLSAPEKKSSTAKKKKVRSPSSSTVPAPVNTNAATGSVPTPTNSPPPSSSTPPPSNPAGGFLNASSPSEASKKSYGKLGAEAFARGQNSRAIEYFSLAIQENDMNHKLYTNRANVYGAMSRHEDALKDAEKSLALSPSAGGFLAQGAALLGLEQFERAIAAVQAAASAADTTPAHQTKAAKLIAEAQKAMLAHQHAKEEAERARAAAAQALAQPTPAASSANAAESLAAQADASTAAASSEVEFDPEHADDSHELHDDSHEADDKVHSDHSATSEDSGVLVHASDANDDNSHTSTPAHSASQSSAPSTLNASAVFVSKADVEPQSSPSRKLVAPLKEELVKTAQRRESVKLGKAIVNQAILKGDKKQLKKVEQKQKAAPAPAAAEAAPVQYNPATMHPSMLSNSLSDLPAASSSSAAPAAAAAAGPLSASAVLPSASADDEEPASPGAKNNKGKGRGGRGNNQRQKKGKESVDLSASESSAAPAAAAEPAAPAPKQTPNRNRGKKHQHNDSTASASSSSDAAATAAAAHTEPTPLTPPPPKTTGWAAMAAKSATPAKQ